MTYVTTPSGYEAEARFSFISEVVDNGMDGPRYRDWIELVATLDDLIVSDPTGEITLDREAASALYGEDWVCAIEREAQE